MKLIFILSSMIMVIGAFVLLTFSESKSLKDQTISRRKSEVSPGAIVIEAEREYDRLLALSKARMDKLFGPDKPKDSESLNRQFREETAYQNKIYKEFLDKRPDTKQVTIANLEQMARSDISAQYMMVIESIGTPRNAAKWLKKAYLNEDHKAKCWNSSNYEKEKILKNVYGGLASYRMGGFYDCWPIISRLVANNSETPGFDLNNYFWKEKDYAVSLFRAQRPRAEGFCKKIGARLPSFSELQNIIGKASPDLRKVDTPYFWVTDTTSPSTDTPRVDPILGAIDIFGKNLSYLDRNIEMGFICLISTEKLNNSGK